MIIQSTLDQDFYKVNMAANILRHHPRTPVIYRFTNRRPEGKFNSDFAKAFKSELDSMGDIKPLDDEIQFLATSAPHLPPHTIDFMANYRFDPKQIKHNVSNGELDLEVKGYWETATMWEVPAMALVSELFFKHCDMEWQNTDWRPTYEQRTIQKAHNLRFCTTSDFGTRRRRSYEIQDLVVRIMKQYHPKFVGTSNVHLACKHRVKPIGTMAHELFMAYSVLRGLRHANRYVLEDWAETFNGDLGIALTDTFGYESFLFDFNGMFARLFDGVRHDSACPYAFTHKTINHYKSLSINPKMKNIVYSNELTDVLAADLEREFRDLINVAFGIGTFFTNDFSFLNTKEFNFINSPALNMVIKLWQVFDGKDFKPVVKLSDVASKQTGDRDALRVANWTFFGVPLDEVR